MIKEIVVIFLFLNFNMDKQTPLEYEFMPWIQKVSL